MMHYKRCSVRLCDIRQQLPLSDNSSIAIAKVASILLKTGDKFARTDSKKSWKRKRKNSLIEIKSRDLLSDSGDDEEVCEKPRKRIARISSDSEDKSSDSNSDPYDYQRKMGGEKHERYKVKKAKNQEKRGGRQHKEQKEKKTKKKESIDSHSDDDEKNVDSESDYKEKSDDSESDHKQRKRSGGKHERHKVKKTKNQEKRGDRQLKGQNEKKSKNKRSHEKSDSEEDESDSDYEDRIDEDSNSDSEGRDESDSDFERKNMSSYEKLIEKKRKEKLEFLESLEIDKVKADLSKVLKSTKKPVKRTYAKAVYPLPSRKSKRTANVVLNYSEDKLLKDVWGKVSREIRYINKQKRKALERSRRLANQDRDFYVPGSSGDWDVKPSKRSTRLANKDYDFSEFFD